MTNLLKTDFHNNDSQSQWAGEGCIYSRALKHETLFKDAGSKKMTNMGKAGFAYQVPNRVRLITNRGPALPCGANAKHTRVAGRTPQTNVIITVLQGEYGEKEKSLTVCSSS